ncbi:hypothetical protein HMPREF2860_09580 [Corynebacterium sp. HMSC064E10]|uniref:hypothetical protein n=1 Tax=Corynebacterium sp. HMSC064E10 TaxID=1739364 RepID=UPI0008A4AB47|nr:hypothetical protein [Corynebacterium sp. HMSC064E10]OFR94308.1 hypothetical protein HMPREF2860_09580 [Corynebacterium sp. HMSC064E10]
MSTSDYRRLAQEKEDAIRDLQAQIEHTRDIIEANREALKTLTSLAFADFGVPQRRVAQWAGVSPTQIHRWNKAVQESLANRHSDDKQSDTSTTADFVPKIFNARQSSHIEEITETDQAKIEARYNRNALQRRLAESN